MKRPCRPMNDNRILLGRSSVPVYLSIRWYESIETGGQCSLFFHNYSQQIPKICKNHAEIGNATCAWHIVSLYHRARWGKPVETVSHTHIETSQRNVEVVGLWQMRATIQIRWDHKLSVCFLENSHVHRCSIWRVRSRLQYQLTPIITAHIVFGQHEATSARSMVYKYSKLLYKDLLSAYLAATIDGAMIFWCTPVTNNTNNVLKLTVKPMCRCSESTMNS
jgi:hypothetical protein